MDFTIKLKEIENELNKKLKDKNLLISIVEKEDEKSATITIISNKKVNKQFEIEKFSCCQINIIENAKNIESGLFINDLTKWIYNLYNPVKYLYEFCGGELNGKVLNIGQVIEISNGLTEDLTKLRKKGLLVHRKELDNQPKVKGYLGPMFNGIDYGKIHLRYETQEIYDMLSE